MTFGILALIVAAGLFGPFLAGIKRLSIPIVVGEIVAGIVLGSNGLGWIHASDPTLGFLSNVGFAMLMFLVGTHLPLRDPALRGALGRGFIATALAFGIGLPIALVLAHYTGIAWALLLLLVATSSTQIVMPIVHERKLAGKTVLYTTTWVAIADTVTLLVLPVAASTGNVPQIAKGILVVAAVAVGCLFLLKTIRSSRVGEYYRGLSKERLWAFDLRLSLIILFGLAAIAVHYGTSVLIAGFAAGSIVQIVGQPRRFFKQLIGIAEGFFVPLFFVDLGARLDFSGLIHSPVNLALAGMLTVCALIVHIIVAKLVRLPIGSGLAATAQMGGPIAVVAVGMASKLLTSGQGAAIIAAALVSLVACSVGTALLARNPANRQAPEDPKLPEKPQDPPQSPEEE